MPSDRFRIAAERAASSYPTGVWSTLSPSERGTAICHELHKLDTASGSESEQAEAPFAGDKAYLRNGWVRVQRADFPECRSGYLA